MNRSFLLAAVAVATLAGCDSAGTDESTYSRAFHSSFKIDRLPFVKPDGTAFDIGSGPDVFVTVADATTNTAVWTSPEVTDVTPNNVPLSWTVNTEVLMDRPYQVCVWDRDPTTVEGMFCTQTFTARSVLNAKQTTYTVADQAGTTSATLTLRFER